MSQQLVDNLMWRFVSRVRDWVPEQWHDQIYKRGLPETAMRVAERWGAGWPESEGWGSSDFSAAMADFLRELGFKVEVINNRYTVTGVEDELTGSRE